MNKFNIPNDEKVYRTIFYRQHYCNPKSPFYVDKTINAMSIYDVVNAIHEAGGVSVLAHILVTIGDGSKLGIALISINKELQAIKWIGLSPIVP